MNERMRLLETIVAAGVRQHADAGNRALRAPETVMRSCRQGSNRPSMPGSHSCNPVTRSEETYRSIDPLRLIFLCRSITP